MAESNDPHPARAYLPEPRVVMLDGRGETFCRVGPARPGRPTVLLLHGWLGTADLTFFAAYEQLAAAAEVIAIDHRGHGRGLRTDRPFTLDAAADDAAALLDALGRRPVIVCGYSMGGPIALELCRRRPDLVEGLVLCATALEFRSAWHERLLNRLLRVFGLGLRFGIDERSWRRVIDDMAAGDDTVARYRAHLLGEAKRLTTHDALDAGRALGRFDARPWAATLDVPTAVVATRRDRVVQPRRQLALAEATAALRFDIEADHDVFVRQPELWSTTLAAAIESVRVRRASGAHTPAA